MRLTTQMVVVLAAGALVLAAPQKKDSPEATFRAAMDKETVDGDLKAAIEQYKKVIASSGASRDVVSKALVRLGMCYERQGSAEARKAYERVVRDFADQQEAAQQARARLAAGKVTVGTGLTTRRVWAGPGVNTYGHVSPDGRYLSFTDSGKGDLAVRDLGSGENRLLTHLPDTKSGSANESVWSPDGKRLAYGFDRHHEIRVINLDGSGVRTLFKANDGDWAEAKGWSADGKRILVFLASATGPRRVFWIAVADGAEQTAVKTGSGYSHHLSPDGRYIAFADSSRSREPGRIYLIGSDGSGVTKLSSNPADEAPVGWSPDSKHVLFTSRHANSLGLWAMPVADGRPQGPPLMLQREVGNNLSTMGITRAGAFYYGAHAFISDIYTATLDQTGKVISAPVPLPIWRTGSNVLPKWSPDGAHILYYKSFAPRQLFVLPLGGGSEQPVQTRIDFTGGGVCWSGDGASAILNVQRGQGFAQLRVSLPTGETKPLSEGSSVSSCSVDGRFGAGVDYQTRAIKVKNFESGSETIAYQFTRGPLSKFAAISPDGLQVAFISNADAWTALIVVPSSGGPGRELIKLKSPLGFQTNYGLSWSPDGRHLYYLKQADEKAPYELFHTSVAGGQEESAGLKLPELRDIAISPDGTRIAFAVGAMNQQEVWAIENFLPASK